MDSRPALWLAAIPAVVGAVVYLVTSREVYNAEGSKRPKTMLALQTTEKGKVELQRVPVPVPKSGEVLVRVSYSPIHPGDAAFSLGKHKFAEEPTYPHGIGFEGSGVVIGSGGGLAAYWAMLCARRVSVRSVTGEGKFWAEYAVVESMHAIPLPSDMALREGALTNVNPITAVSMLVIARDEGHKALVHTAATSSLGLQLLRAAPKFGVKIVAVVRGEKNARILSEEMKHPAELIVRTDVPSFKSDLKRAVQTTGATLAFDAISGDVARTVYASMPDKARVHTYGDLSGQGMPEDLLDKADDPDKPFSFFSLGPWLEAGGLWRMIRITHYQSKMLTKELTTTVGHEICLDDPALIDVFYAYAEHQKSGKIVIKMPSESSSP